VFLIYVVDFSIVATDDSLVLSMQMDLVAVEVTTSTNTRQET
jgi:hypothetical protein